MFETPGDNEVNNADDDIEKEIEQIEREVAS